MLRRLERKERMVLATVISRSGSGPREPGASLLIGADGGTLGTVGGGILEARVTDQAREAIRQGRSFCRKFALTAKEAAGSGMTCGGRMEVLIDCWESADAIRRAIVAQALRSQAAGTACWFVHSIRREEGAGSAGKGSAWPPPAQGAAAENEAMPEAGLPVQTGLGLIAGDDFTPGSLDMSGLDPDLLKKERRRMGTVLVEGRSVRYLVQPLGAAETVLIAGAGHVAGALAPLCRFAGFKTAIMDDRADFANRENFPDADEILVPLSFEHCFGNLQIGENHYVVIVTRGHAHDREVLAQALRTAAGYIGMIGSRRKRDIIYRALLAEGFTAGDLARVHCPIGLPIGAQTPEEIAVSIAAELIAARSKSNHESL